MSVSRGSLVQGTGLLQGTHLLPLCSCSGWGMWVLGAAEAQATGLPRKGQAGPVSGGAMIPGTFSTLWARVVVLVGSREFWRPPTHPLGSGSSGTVLTLTVCYGTSG